MGNSQGNNQGDSTAGGEDKTVFPSVLHSHWTQLYLDLNDCPDIQEGTKETVIKERFILLFGGSSDVLGEKLFKYFFHGPQSLILDAFIQAMAAMKAMLDTNKTIDFLYDVFFTSTDFSADLCSLLQVAALCGLSVGCHSDNVEVPVGHPLLTAMTSAICNCSDGSTMKCATLKHWLTLHCPRLFTGVTMWLTGILQPISPDTYNLPAYHLPTVQEGGSQVELQLLVWVLSSVLHTSFMGATQGKASLAETSDLPAGGVWTCLYSSSKHGFSLNRFKHHCYDYRQPSVMFVECRSRLESTTYLYAIAMDTEWRDGAFFYGGDHFHLVQLKPVYSVLTKGAKLISLNEKQRGFPKGLRVMVSDKHASCMFEVQESLEEARLREGEWMTVVSITVWGCGGVEAMETQHRMKNWAEKEIMRRRQINHRELRANWMDNPDRLLLKMGGIETSRPQDRPH